MGTSRNAFACLLMLIAAAGVTTAGEPYEGRVAAGGHHSMAIRVDGSLWTWGRDYAGQLGIGSTENQPSPVRVVLDPE